MFGEIPSFRADARDPLVLGQAHTLPEAVVELGLAVTQRQVLVLVLLRLDATDVSVGRGVLEAANQQRRHRLETLKPVGAGKLVGALGGQVAPLPGIDDHLVIAEATCDRRLELTGAHQHSGQTVDAFRTDVPARVLRQADLLQWNVFKGAVDGLGAGAGDVEQPCGYVGAGRVDACGGAPRHVLLPCFRLIGSAGGRARWRLCAPGAARPGPPRRPVRGARVGLA